MIRDQRVRSSSKCDVPVPAVVVWFLQQQQAAAAELLISILRRGMFVACAVPRNEIAGFPHSSSFVLCKQRYTAVPCQPYSTAVLLTVRRTAACVRRRKTNVFRRQKRNGCKEPTRTVIDEPSNEPTKTSHDHGQHYSTGVLLWCCLLCYCTEYCTYSIQYSTVLQRELDTAVPGIYSCGASSLRVAIILRRRTNVVPPLRYTYLYIYDKKYMEI